MQVAVHGCGWACRRQWCRAAGRQVVTRRSGGVGRHGAGSCGGRRQAGGRRWFWQVARQAGSRQAEEPAGSNGRQVQVRVRRQCRTQTVRHLQRW